MSSEKTYEKSDRKIPSTPPLKETDAAKKSNCLPGDSTTDAPMPKPKPDDTGKKK